MSNQNIYEASVKYDKVQEDGTLKKVIEKYLLHALSIYEANSVITEVMAPYITGDFSVEGIKRIKVDEMYDAKSADDNVWYMVKVGTVVLDERTAQEKVSVARCLVCRKNFDSAVDAVRKAWSENMMEWYIISAAETTYVDYFNNSNQESDDKDDD